MVSFRVGPISYTVGRADFLGSFFDTITVRLEGGSRGSSYPLLASLYAAGELPSASAAAARDELRAVVDALGAFPPKDVVWDADDSTRRAPWGDEIAPSIVTLADYHVTADGRRLHEVLDTALDASARVERPLTLSSPPGIDQRVPGQTSASPRA
jgi:hypothetical protein